MYLLLVCTSLHICMLYLSYTPIRNIQCHPKIDNDMSNMLNCFAHQQKTLWDSYIIIYPYYSFK